MPLRTTASRLVLFSAAALIYCGAGLVPGRRLVPIDGLRDLGAFQPDLAARTRASNRLLSDVTLQFIPWDAAARRAVASGQIPWRDTDSGNGAPLFANPQAALLYPLTWLRLLAGFRGWGLGVFAKLLATGLGTAWLASEMGAADSAAAVSGLVAEMSGFAVAWAFHPHTNVFSVLPALAAAALRLWRRFTPGNLALVILFSALATAGGHPETLACGVAGIAAFLVVLPRAEGDGRSWRLARVAAAGACGFLLLSVQLVPFLHLASSSAFASSRATWGAGSFRWAAAAAQVLPGFLGAPLHGEMDLTLGISGSENFISRGQGYVGALVLMFLALGWPRLPAVFRRGLLVGALFLAMAWRIPPLGLLRSRLPLFSLGASQFWIVTFVIFASAAAGPALYEAAAAPGRRRPGFLALAAGLMLAAGGIAPRIPPMEARLAALNQRETARLRQEGLLARPRDPAEDLRREQTTAVRRALIPGLCLIVAGAELCRKRSRPRVLAAAAAGELATFGFGFLPAVAVADFPPPPECIAVVRRLDPDNRFRVAAGPGVLPANLAAFYGRRDPRSFDLLQDAGEMSRLTAAGFDATTSSFSSSPSPRELRALGNLSVRYFFSRNTVVDCARVGGSPPPAVGVYEIDSATPSSLPADSAPEGICAGATLSLLAAAGGATWLWSLSRRR